MKILLDNNAPRGLVRALRGHTVTEARELGWDALENGALITAAEDAGFDVIVTLDQRIKYQQNLKSRKIALVVLTKGRWTLVRWILQEIIIAVDEATPGSYREVVVPFRD